MTATRPARSAARAFTLLELLIAVTIFSIVLVAINTVFYSALRLRERTSAVLDESLPRSRALSIMRNDLRCILPPGGVLATSFVVGAVNLGFGNAQAQGLQCFTTTGRLDDNQPWGDVQEVTYALQPPTDRAHAVGKDLIRYVSRNLLATVQEPPEQQWLLGGIDRMEFLCFDGNNWRDSWDTTMGDTNLPAAIRVRLLMAATNAVMARNPEILELLVPLSMQVVATNETASTEEGQQ